MTTDGIPRIHLLSTEAALTTTRTGDQITIKIGRSDIIPKNAKFLGPEVLARTNGPDRGLGNVNLTCREMTHDAAGATNGRVSTDMRKRHTVSHTTVLSATTTHAATLAIETPSLVTQSPGDIVGPTTSTRTTHPRTTLRKTTLPETILGSPKTGGWVAVGSPTRLEESRIDLKSDPMERKSEIN